MSAPTSESSEARQKFANAKAISSDMFFGRESSAEVRRVSVAPLQLPCRHVAAVVHVVTGVTGFCCC